MLNVPAWLAGEEAITAPPDERRVRAFTSEIAEALRKAAKAPATVEEAPALLVSCATFACADWRWASSETAVAANDLLSSLARALGWKTASETVCALLGGAFSLLAPRLDGGRWKHDEPASHAIVWLVTTHVRHPHLSPFAGPLVVLGAALLGDAGHTSNRVLGAALLAHCAAQLNAAELRWNGELLQREIIAAVRTADVAVLRSALPCAIAAARVFGDTTDSFRRELLSAWVEALHYATERPQRSLLLRHLSALLGVVGMAEAMPLLPALVSILSDAISVPDQQQQQHAIASAEHLLRVCWPRMRSGSRHHSALVHAASLGQVSLPPLFFVTSP